MYYTVGNFYPDWPIHTCPRCMRGLPCDPSSLSSVVGAIATRQRTADEWKETAFNPTPEAM